MQQFNKMIQHLYEMDIVSFSKKDWFAIDILSL